MEKKYINKIIEYLESYKSYFCITKPLFVRKDYLSANKGIQEMNIRTDKARKEIEDLIEMLRKLK